MKIRVNRDKFVESVGWVSRNAATNGDAGVTAGVLFETRDNAKVLMGATNGTNTGKNLLDAEVLEAGKGVIPARLLADFSRSLPAGGTIELTVGATGAILASGDVQFQMPVLPVSNYPALVKMPAATGTISSADFAAAVAQVAIATSKDDGIPTLTAIRIEVDGSDVHVVATDRYRMAHRSIKWSPSQTDVEAQVMVPTLALTEAAKSFGSSGADITLALAADGDDALVGIANSEAAIVTRQISGDFPKWRMLFAADFESTAKISTDRMAAALKRAALAAEMNAAVKLTFGEGKVLVEAGDLSDAGKGSREPIPCEYDGPPVVVGFNPSFMAAGISATGSETVTISLNGSEKPAVISGDGDYRYLVMPVRLPA